MNITALHYFLTKILKQYLSCQSYKLTLTHINWWAWQVFIGLMKLEERWGLNTLFMVSFLPFGECGQCKFHALSCFVLCFMKLQLSLSSYSMINPRLLLILKRVSLGAKWWNEAHFLQNNLALSLIDDVLYFLHPQLSIPSSFLPLLQLSKSVYLSKSALSVLRLSSLFTLIPKLMQAEATCKGRNRWNIYFFSKAPFFLDLEGILFETQCKVFI